MQIAGVQPVGSKGFATVQGVVTDARAERGMTAATAGDGVRTTAAGTHALSAEPVVFPREGRSVDQRPVHLRQEKATARYREHDDEPAPERRTRRRL